MTWLEVDKVDVRKELIYRYLRKEKITDLCREYQISRKTAYKFIHRFEQYGLDGLKDSSRRPHHLANQTDGFLERLIIDAKVQYPSWGAKKLKPRLEALYPSVHFPSISTISAILSRNGMVRSSPRRLRRSYPPSHLSMSQKPNDIWCVDFKGQFQTRDHRYCYPLTITDHYSRFLIACEALPSPSQDQAFPVFQESFMKHGLPRVIRSDNGSPFASSSAPYGLTGLAVWFLKVGITLERIDPGHPEQNGRHERLHRTLKEEALQRVAANLLHQQEIFDEFQRTYNQERPHEAIFQQTPASWYHPSEHSYSGEDGECEYPDHTLVKTVDPSGCIALFNDHSVRISKVFSGERIGLKDVDHYWLVSFSHYDIGMIRKDTLKFESMEVLDD